MGGFLRQATAAQIRTVGPFVDDTDFKTLKTGLTIANTDIKLVVNGGASANKNSGGGTHRVNGVYGLTFDATDTATVGELQLSVLVAGALVVFDVFYVVEEAVFDGLFVAAAPGFSTVAALATVQADTDDIQTRLPAALTANGNIKADALRVGGTTQTGGDLAAMLTIIDDFIDTEVAAILAAVDTEVASILALLDDPRGEPGQGAPPVNPDMATKMDYLYKNWRNKKTNDGITNSYFADDGTTVDQKSSTSSAAGTVTIGEIVAGP